MYIELLFDSCVLVTPLRTDIMSIVQPSSGCFKNRFLIVTFSTTQCVEEDVTGFIVNCSGSTCISERVECPPNGNITELTVVLGARIGSHKVNVYAVNRCHPATRTVDAPIDGKLEY